MQQHERKQTDKQNKDLTRSILPHSDLEPITRQICCIQADQVDDQYSLVVTCSSYSKGCIYSCVRDMVRIGLCVRQYGQQDNK